MRIIRLVAVLGFALLARVAWAQVAVASSCPSGAPVLLQPGPLPTVPGEPEVVTITNKGTRAITATILTWKVTDSKGTSYPSTSVVDHAPSGRSLGPGENVHTEVVLSVAPGNAIASVDVGCLAVLFVGKEIWGDKTSPEVDHLLGMRQGMLSERKRLLNIYKKEGTVGLIDELNRPCVR